LDLPIRNAKFQVLISEQSLSGSAARGKVRTHQITLLLYVCSDRGDWRQTPAVICADMAPAEFASTVVHCPSPGYFKAERFAGIAINHSELLMSTWTLLHLFTDENSVSCVDFGYTQPLQLVEFAPPAPSMYVARASDADALAFVELPVDWHGGWHPSPKAQWVICLSGVMEYQAGDGTRFTLHPGDCILTTDTTGQGHDSWNAGSEPIRLALVQMQTAPLRQTPADAT
jgi:hypothetical protein